MPLRLWNKNAKMTVAQNLLAPFVSEKVLAAFLNIVILIAQWEHGKVK